MKPPVCQQNSIFFTAFFPVLSAFRILVLFCRTVPGSDAYADGRRDEDEWNIFYFSVRNSGTKGAEASLFGRDISCDTAHSGHPFGAWLRILPAGFHPLGRAGCKGTAG